MKVTKLLHTRMRVSDMEQTIRFYTEVLGLEVLERKVSPRGSHLAFLKVPNSEELIELCSFPSSGPVIVQEDLVHLAFQVENLDDTIEQLGAKPLTDELQRIAGIRRKSELPAAFAHFNRMGISAPITFDVTQD